MKDMKKSKDSENLEEVFSSDHVMSLLENMSDGIAVISEQCDGLSVRMGGLESRMDSLETKVNRIDVRLDHLETKVDNLEVRFDTLETKVDTLQEDVTEIKHKLSQKVDLEDFQKLEKRLIKVESFVFKFAKKL